MTRNEVAAAGKSISTELTVWWNISTTSWKLPSTSRVVLIVCLPWYRMATQIYKVSLPQMFFLSYSENTDIAGKPQDFKIQNLASLVVQADVSPVMTKLSLWRYVVSIAICIQLESNLTHWGRDKMDVISQTTFSNAFSWMKMFELWLKFHWSLLPKVQLTISQHWCR